MVVDHRRARSVDTRGSVPGVSRNQVRGATDTTPPSLTCSVHCLPSQYLSRCRPAGSGYQLAEGIAPAIGAGAALLTVTTSIDPQFAHRAQRSCPDTFCSCIVWRCNA